IDYSSMMQKAGRETNKEFLNQMVESQEIAQLPDADAYGSYKHLMKVTKENTEENGENKEAEANAFDPNQAALQAEYRKGGLTATRQYLELLEGNEDAMDSLRQSASGLYGQLGVYSRGGENENLSGLVGGRMEAAVYSRP
ncbi:MAG: hypothetical protein LUB63_03600, partial [Oscillospiraceae bacterium]|nr:hypothetical protein [Oscillospiraceae bacterium]